LLSTGVLANRARLAVQILVQAIEVVRDVLQQQRRRSGLALLPTEERLALIYPRGRRLLPAVQRAMELCRTIVRAR